MGRLFFGFPDRGPVSPLLGTDFQGTQRFQVLSCLGAGGMGVVYAALDRERNERVALKTLRTMTAEALLRFKNEFRALQDLQHPNLVSLGELIEDSGRWFFTMELVDGVSFLSYVRPQGSAVSTPGALEDTSASSPAGEATDASGEAAKKSGPAPIPWEDESDDASPIFDEARLRSTMGQLALGLTALHSAGKVHRDVKPSNILVTGKGRVVLVDFGLVADLAPRENWEEARAVGTTTYMAPEQAAALRVGPAADWYSVGVILYQVLAGRVPFDGSPIEVLRKKARTEPPPPRWLAPHAPADLDALCVSLLHIDPVARPSAREVLRRLHIDESGEPVSTDLSASLPATTPFVGRLGELTRLREAFRDIQKEKTVTVYLHGESGVGKSALVRRFTEGLAADSPNAVVLAGRCYERESVPYKAIDGVVDALSRYMRKLPKIDAVALLPLKATHLAQVFPALKQVEAIAELPRPLHELADPQELRSRMFAAFRELFARLAERHPVVVVIDDLQWADADSVTLLRDLVRQPDAPPLLVCATMRTRSDPQDDKPADDFLAISDGTQHIYLERLPAVEARELAALLVARLPTPDKTDAAAIAAEAGGHPLFIDELVRHAQLSGEGVPARLDDALHARISRLDKSVRYLVQVIAVAGTPLPQDLAARAAQCDAAEFRKIISALRVAHLVRTTGARTTDPVEPYHDRVREAVLAHLGAETRKSCHERLAVTLEASGTADPEALAAHWGGAGDTARAAHYAAEAAARAAKALAFDHAAHLYRQALEHAAGTGAETRALTAHLADALANAGRGAEAAAMYLVAAASASATERLDLQRKAAERFLLSGHLDEGMAVLEPILAQVGMKLSSTPRRALLSLAARRVLIRLRGLGYRERDESQISQSELMRIDLCWSLSAGMAVVDYITGADFHTRNLLAALRAGEPFRVARALVAEASFSSAGGGRTRLRTARLVQAAQTLAEKLNYPYALGYAWVAAALAAEMEGRWSVACEYASQAETIFRDRCTGVAWEIACVQMFSLTCLYYRGRLAEMCERQARYVREGRERGDLFSTTEMTTGEGNIAWLMEDRPSAARQHADQALKDWSERGVIVRVYMDLVAQLQIDLYLADGATGWARMSARWEHLERSLLLNVQMIRIIATHLRARIALCAAARDPQGPERKRQIACAEKAARRLAREAMPWADALSLLIRAGLASLNDKKSDALDLLATAATRFDSVDMGLYAAASRGRRGELLGGDMGRVVKAGADAWMAAQHIENPARMTDMLAPGFR